MLPTRLAFDQLEYNDDGLHLHDSIPFTGIAYREQQGILRYEQHFKNGLPWGAGATWNERGAIQSTMSYYAGALHGKKMEFDGAERAAKEEIYEFGVLLMRKRRDESGNMTEEFRLNRDSPNFRVLSALRSMYPDAALDVGEIAQD